MNVATTQTKTARAQREGVVVRPDVRLSQAQIEIVDAMSRELLAEPGLLCHNDQACDLLAAAGAKVQDAGRCRQVRLPGKLIDRALASAPSTVVLGARDPANRLVLDAREPRVRFGSGSETNIWLDVSFDEARHPRFERQPGSIARLADAAHLCEHLENLDFFIRCVNIQDQAVTVANKDVNKFFVSLDNMTKHVQAGLTDLSALDAVMELGSMIAGGADAFAANPVFSFITCVIKSPMEVVDDTTDKLLAIARHRAPVVISSCPMGGASGPFDELGMTVQVNAEVLAGVVLTQLASEGAPVLYGAVPVRTRLDNLNDMYAAPEFAHYTIACAQMARHYALPCYSTAGVADASVPGVQATAEKMLTLLTAPRGGAQYVHYAFGLLERTNTFCPEQAVLDDAHIGLIKRTLSAGPSFDEAGGQQTLAAIREAMASDHRSYIYDLPLPTRSNVYVRYPLESDDGALFAAHERYRQILQRPAQTLDDDLRRQIARHVPGILEESLTAGSRRRP